MPGFIRREFGSPERFLPPQWQRHERPNQGLLGWLLIPRSLPLDLYRGVRRGQPLATSCGS